MVPVYRYLLLVAFLLPLGVFGQSRDTTFLEGIISSDRSLTAGKAYVVKHNVLVAKEATLTIPGNTKLLMNFNTTIVVEGGLKMSGNPGAMVEVTSSNPETPGIGVLIRGHEGKDIEIKNTKFSQIKVPVKFDADWFRENVAITNNIFTNIFTGEPTIYIINPTSLSSITSGKKATVVFSNNSYISNWGSIYIENFQSDVMDLQFSDNLLTNNVVYAVKAGDPSNALIYGMYDDMKTRYEAKFSGNSIFGNYQINSSVDTIMREVGIGIQGSGEAFNIPSNFFRSTDAPYISSTFDHFYQNSDLPLLQVDPIAPTPGESVPPHIYKVKINNKDIYNYGALPPLATRDMPVEVFFNKSVDAFGTSQVESIVYDTATNELVINPVEITDGQWSPDHKRYTFKVNNASFLNGVVGYLVISNFKDANGQAVPEFSIGQQHAVNNYRKFEGVTVKSGDLMSRPDEFGGLDFDINKGAFLKSKEDVKTLQALTDLGDLSYLGPYESLKKSWEVGGVIGASNYSGTMTDRFTRRDHYHISGGIYGQYNAHKWFSLRAMLWYGQISGNDRTISSLATRNRLHNFKNYLIEGSATFHWHLLPYGTNRGERFVPSLFAGIAMFWNNPRARVLLTLDEAGDPVYLRWNADNDAIAVDWLNNTDGYDEGKDIWIPLHAIGTEGQTVKDKTDPEANSNSPDAAFFQGRTAPKQYKKIQVSIPVGAEISWIIRNSWNIGATFGIRLTTGRYLDDLGGYYFDRINGHQAIVKANMGTITGRTRSDKGLNIPDVINYVNDQGVPVTAHTAALLSNPGYGGDGNDPNTASNYAFSINEPGDNHDARRTEKNIGSYDIYFFGGVKVTKVFKRDPEKEKKKQESKGKDAFEKDTDGDGITDSEEKKLGTNAKNADSDGDGLTDSKEQELKTKPTVKDTDNDGVIDGKDKCPTVAGAKKSDGCPD